MSDWETRSGVPGMTLSSIQENGRIIWVSDFAREHFGMKASDVGRPSFDFLDEEGRAVLCAARRELEATGCARTWIPIPLVDGTTGYVDLFARAVVRDGVTRVFAWTGSILSPDEYAELPPPHPTRAA